MNSPWPNTMRVCLRLGLATVAGLWLGCQTTSVTDLDGVIVSKGARETSAVEQLPVPLGLERDQVTPRIGEALQRSRQSLAQIMRELPRPDYLSRIEDSDADRVVEDDPGPPLAAQRAYLAGRMAWLNGQRFEAVNHLQSALRLYPQSAHVLRLLGHIYTRSGNKIRAAVYLERAVRQDPGDVDSLYLLGRFAGDRGDRSAAIVTLADAADRVGEEHDPALPALIQYFLGHALAQQGYDKAAIEQLTAYLDLSQRIDRTTRMVRELAVLARQRASTWQTVGDAYNRLGQLADALKAYEEAQELEQQLPEGLARRLVYTGLRMGRADQASRALLRYMRHAGPDKTALGLVSYLGSQGVESGQLVGQLRELYDRGDHASLLVIAIADLMEPADAYTFLDTHLRSQPADRSVFEHLVTRQLFVAKTPKRVRHLLETTIALIAVLPTAADEYASFLFDAVDDPDLMLDATNALPQESRQHPVGHYIAGKALVRVDRLDDAADELAKAIEADPDLVAARVELASIRITQGDFERADELLAVVADSTDARVVELRIKVMQSRGQTRQAIQFLDDLLAGHPADKIGLLIEKAKIQEAMGNAAGAQQTLSDALDEQPHDQRLYEQLIRLYRSGKFSDAQKNYRQLITRMFETIPHARVARVERARLLVTTGQYDQAEPLLLRLEKEDPTDIQVLEPMLTMLTRTEREGEARALIRDRLDATPGDRQLLALALRYYRTIEDADQTSRIALKLLADLIAQRPRNLGALDTLIDLLLKGGKREQAEELLLDRLSEQPDDRTLLLLAARHYERADDQPRLFEMTERLLLSQPSSQQRSQELAALYMRHDHPRKAINVLDEALAVVEPGQNVRLLVSLLSRAWIEAGDPGEADGVFEQAIDRFPDRAAELTVDWAMHHERRGRRAQAQRILIDLLKTNPQHPMANNQLGYTWADLGKHLDRAEQMIRVAVDADPDNAAYLDSMGWVLYKRGKFNDAVTWLQRASAAPGGEYPVILDHLGDALYRVGRHKLAVTTWRQARGGLGKFDSGEDAELEGLTQELQEKIQSVASGQKPPIAEAPELEEQRTDDTDKDAAPQAVGEPTPKGPGALGKATTDPSVEIIDQGDRRQRAIEDQPKPKAVESP